MTAPIGSSQQYGKIALPRVIIDGTERILDWAKQQPIGFYVLYTQNALDSESPGDVSFTLLNKAAADYMYFYQFAYNKLYYANASRSTQNLAWAQMV